MTLDQYLKLVDWTGRQLRKDKKGKIPTECLPILERLSCNEETWLDFVEHFRQRFRTAAGLAPSQNSFRSLLRSRKDSLAG